MCGRLPTYYLSIKWKDSNLKEINCLSSIFNQLSGQQNPDNSLLAYKLSVLITLAKNMDIASHTKIPVHRLNTSAASRAV